MKLKVMLFEGLFNVYVNMKLVGIDVFFGMLEDVVYWVMYLLVDV